MVVIAASHLDRLQNIRLQFAVPHPSEGYLARILLVDPAGQACLAEHFPEPFPVLSAPSPSSFSRASPKKSVPSGKISSSPFFPLKNSRKWSETTSTWKILSKSLVSTLEILIEVFWVTGVTSHFTSARSIRKRSKSSGGTGFEK